MNVCLTLNEQSSLSSGQSQLPEAQKPFHQLAVDMKLPHLPLVLTG